MDPIARRKLATNMKKYPSQWLRRKRWEAGTEESKTMLCLPRLSPCPSLPRPHPLILCDSVSLAPNISNSIEFTDNRSGGRCPSCLCRAYRSFSYRKHNEEWSDDSLGSDRLLRFEQAMKLFNQRDYYACHDLLESLWYDSNDPLRTLLHALLQCAVAFHHLFNQNHKGAMMEMGEGVCKLRKLNLEGGPFYEFEQEISDVLNFIYQLSWSLLPVMKIFALQWNKMKGHTNFWRVMELVNAYILLMKEAMRI